ncbi:hypothetical protein ACHHYP_10138 [Achlya hypogyna]|uniref:Ubiquitin-like domain-containing protein n=1 Tax=Achlya hypogyna TaxID=1202772 RepID=A0A1V9ZI61_ACHHY|nr:hypothetical protein ACHHYP_10138 [Achlya hypogyna]
MNVEDMLIKVAVKNVYERDMTVSLEMAASSTVLMLKEYLHERFQALPNHQRLIFGGKICENTQTLAQVLKRMEPNEVYTFHLLVSNPDKTAPPSRPASEPAAVPVPAPVAPPVAPAVSPPANSVPIPASTPMPTTVPISATLPPFPLPNMPVPPMSHVPLFPFPPAPSSPPLTPPHAAPCFPSMSGPQSMQLQHYLAQQETLLLMQIQFLKHLQECQQIYGHHRPSTSTSPLTNISSFTTRTFTVYRDEAPAAEPPAPVERRRLAAVRAVLLLLDLKLAVKMAVMMYIIGQDLPLPRLYLLIGISVVIYLYLTGIVNKVYDMVQGNHPEAPTPIPNAANDNNEFEMPPVDVPGRPFLTIPAEGGWWKDMQIFVMGLVVSLLPSWRPLPAPPADAPLAPEPLPVGQDDL